MISNLQSPLPEFPEQSGPCRTVGLCSDDVESVFQALSSETRREIFVELYHAPGTASGLADRVGTSLQNSVYHLEQLESAQLVRIISTRYSSKGHDMNVYAPANEPLVIVIGTEANYHRLRKGIQDRAKETRESNGQKPPWN